MTEEHKGIQGSGNYVGPNSTPSRVVQLRDGGVRPGQLIDAALSNLTESQTQALMGKAAEEALRLEVKAREQNLDYVVGKKAVEDHIETFDALDKRGLLTRQNVTSNVKTGAGTMHVESKSGATCFVATAAYGNAYHPNVRFLRAFRDEWLRHHRVGVAFIDWYWKVGPFVADVVRPYASMRLISRVVLSGVVRVIRLFWDTPR